MKATTDEVEVVKGIKARKTYRNEAPHTIKAELIYLAKPLTQLLNMNKLFSSALEKK